MESTKFSERINIKPISIFGAAALIGTLGIGAYKWATESNDSHGPYEVLLLNLSEVVAQSEYKQVDEYIADYNSTLIAHTHQVKQALMEQGIGAANALGMACDKELAQYGLTDESTVYLDIGNINVTINLTSKPDTSNGFSAFIPLEGSMPVLSVTNPNNHTEARDVYITDGNVVELVTENELNTEFKMLTYTNPTPDEDEVIRYGQVQIVKEDDASQALVVETGACKPFGES